jgi:uncharacterized protein
VSKKSAKIAALIEACRGRDLPAHYLGYFECFNRGMFYEAHDVLEELWLPNRGRPDDAFFKGLIQFAGAFVHLQKHSAKYQRLRPAAALFRLARANLGKYPSVHRRLNLHEVASIADDWIARLEKTRYVENPFNGENAPRIHLAETM